MNFQNRSTSNLCPQLQPTKKVDMRNFQFLVFLVLTFCAPLPAQEVAYYKAIQKGSSAQVQPTQFKELEENALKNYSKPESYDAIATAFGNTTEKVWAVIYGEIYCDLSSDTNRINQIGSLAYGWYDRSLSKNGNNLSVDLTENAQGIRNVVPFESQFEQSFLMGAIAVRNDLLPLSIAKLTAIRRQQILLWSQRRLPETELVRRQRAILSAGHFDAYNYWLFKSARPDEFNEWMKGHEAQYQEWLDWQKKNEFKITAPDFQRLFLLRSPRSVSATTH
jgi:hypothetical protein